MVQRQYERPILSVSVLHVHEILKDSRTDLSARFSHQLVGNAFNAKQQILVEDTSEADEHECPEYEACQFSVVEGGFHIAITPIGVPAVCQKGIGVFSFLFMAALKLKKSPSKVDVAYVRRVRDLCLDLPEVVEGATRELPGFCVAKQSFAEMEKRSGKLVLFLRVGEGEAPLPKAPDREGWAAVPLDKNTDWREVRELVLLSYCVVAPTKMLRALDSALTH